MIKWKALSENRSGCHKSSALCVVKDRSERNYFFSASLRTILVRNSPNNCENLVEQNGDSKLHLSPAKSRSESLAHNE